MEVENYFACLLCCCHLGWRTLVLKCNKNNYDCCVAAKQLTFLCHDNRKLFCLFLLHGEKKEKNKKNAFVELSRSRVKIENTFFVYVFACVHIYMHTFAGENLMWALKSVDTCVSKVCVCVYVQEYVSWASWAENTCMSKVCVCMYA